MHRPRTPPAGRPSRLVAGLIALGAGLVAVLLTVGCHAFNRVVLADGLGLAVPDLLVRIGGALLGTAAAALAATRAFRLVDGPVPPGEKEPPSHPAAGEVLRRPHETGNGRANEHCAAYARGKEELPWT